MIEIHLLRIRFFSLRIPQLFITDKLSVYLERDLKYSLKISYKFNKIGHCFKHFQRNILLIHDSVKITFYCVILHKIMLLFLASK